MMNSLLPLADTPPKHNAVTDWLDAGVQSGGETAAVAFHEDSLSYQELDAFSNRIANLLVEQGVPAGGRVGICLDRSIELVAVLIGILKAGAAYVPLDPAYPKDRLKLMLEDAQLSGLIAHSEHAGLFEEPLIWEEIEDAVARMPLSPCGRPVLPEQAAYIIFTSGSTGRPKGIEMPHRALANLIEWQLERETFKPVANVLQYSSISFDVSFQEIATTLASGGTLFLISNDDRKDPRKLLTQLIDQKIGRLFLPYVAMRSMIEAAHVTETFPGELKEIITAGEQLRVDQPVRDFFARIPGASLDNQYGPSETHVITGELLTGDPAGWPDLPPIGKAIKNCGTVILDEEMKPVSAGEEGELYLAGRNLAHGYIGREDLTAEAFIKNPLPVTDRPVLYKTGDMAKYNADGAIEFLGRRDHQIKILGHRIEPGEINNVISQRGEIGQCLTHAFKNEDGVLRLASYYTVKDGASIEYAQLRSHLDAKLPDYMVPAFLIELDELPYTPSGKVDLKSLPKPSIQNSRYAQETISYSSDTERELAGIWEELLGLKGIPATADFFELGGDSLRAVTLFLKIQQRFNKEFPLATLMHASTIRALARLIDGEKSTADVEGCRSLKCIQPGHKEKAPLFMVHGGAGNTLIFKDLARNLGEEWPVYAFQWSGWDGRPGETTIESMASVYVDELLSVAGNQTFYLGGHCIGGLIALEMGRLLKAKGVDFKEPILITDTPNIRSRKYRPRDNNLQRFEKMRTRLFEKKITDCDIDSLSISSAGGGLKGIIKGSRLYAHARNLKTEKRIMTLHEQAGKGKPVPVDARPFYSGQMMHMALRAYKARKYDGRILYFRSGCHGERMHLSGWWDDVFLGFEELCSGNFTGHIIGGGHDEILSRPELEELVKGVWEA